MKVQKYQNPSLRFSGFTEPWELKPMSQILKLEIRPIKMKDASVYSLITVKRGNRGVVSRGEYEGRKVLVKSQFEVRTGDFVISKRQIVHQACGIVPSSLNGSIVSNEYNVFGPTEECDLQYFDYFTFRPQMRHAFFLSCVGVHLEKMLFKTNDWLKRKFYFPTLPEQKKIADFLTSVDDRIGQLIKKKALLEDYKKGVMQQLFSQQIRFKDDNGNDFPDWEEKKLGELATCLDNLRRPVNATEREKMKGDIPYYGANGIQGYVNDFIFDEDLTLLAEDGGNFDEFSNRPIAQRVTGKAWVNNHAHILRAKPLNITPAFLFHSLVHKDIRKYINGSSRAKLNKGDMLTIAMIVPNVPEQKKIADFLSAIDQKIERVSQQITKTQTFKKGLLQQMFV
ncbi:restriction endonuclease subunit S [Akkermansiaceae bacterium]|nr:restriction endonuclease subunit S [Akkermansiaceae bacterium]MDB4791577.1 restriction endonuclease subunit S [Akkermansiaceae bacterium]